MFQLFRKFCKRYRSDSQKKQSCPTLDQTGRLQEIKTAEELVRKIKNGEITLRDLRNDTLSGILKVLETVDQFLVFLPAKELRRRIEREIIKRIYLNAWTDQPSKFMIKSVSAISGQTRLEDGISESGSGDTRILEAESDLFFSQWFRGQNRILHGADVMFAVGPMLEKFLAGTEDKIFKVGKVKFLSPIRNNLRITVEKVETFQSEKRKSNGITEGPRPAFIIELETESGGKIEVIGHEIDEKSITREAPSNIFAGMICGDHAADLIIDRDDFNNTSLAKSGNNKITGTRPIQLNSLSEEEKKKYQNFRNLNKSGMDYTLVMDIAITMITAFAYAAGLNVKGILGGGFNNFTFDEELIMDLLEGQATFQVTNIGTINNREKSTSQPIQFEIKNNNGQTISSGEFLWANLK